MAHWTAAAIIKRIHDEINVLMPKRYFCTYIKFIVFKKHILQAANTDLYNSFFVPKAHIASVKIYHFLYKLNQVKVSESYFEGFFCTLGSNGLSKMAKREMQLGSGKPFVCTRELI